MLISVLAPLTCPVQFLQKKFSPSQMTGTTEEGILWGWGNPIDGQTSTHRTAETPHCHTMTRQAKPAWRVSQLVWLFVKAGSSLVLTCTLQKGQLLHDGLVMAKQISIFSSTKAKIHQDTSVSQQSWTKSTQILTFKSNTQTALVSYVPPLNLGSK